MMKFRFFLRHSTFFFLLAVLPISQVIAAPPASKVVLEIGGNISKSNDKDRYVFDRASLEVLGGKTIKTHTPWTDDQITFEGVLLRDLLKFVGAEGKQVAAMGLDDYKVTLPMDLIKKYPVMIAYKKNGDYMTVRDMGPLWIIFPYDDHPELSNQRNDFYWVWQLHKLEVQ